MNLTCTEIISVLIEVIPKAKIISLKITSTTLWNIFRISNYIEFSGLLGSWILSTVQHYEEHEVSETGSVCVLR
jgi:hypothetical protein